MPKNNLKAVPAENSRITADIKELIVKRYSGDPVTETLTNGFFTVDKKWEVLYWNKEAEKILGVRLDDMMGQNLWNKLAGVLPVEFYDIYYKAFLQDTPVHFEEYWGEMGAWFDVIVYHCDDTISVSFKSSNHQQPRSLDSVAKRLKTLSELYRYVIEITNDCLWEWNLINGEMFWIDGGHRRVFGYKIENALIPQSFWESLIHPDDKTRVLKTLDQTLSNGKFLWEEEYRFKKHDDSYACVRDRGHVIYDEEGTATRIIGATQDISKMKHLEHKLAAARISKENEFTQAIITSQEKERAIIGNELHDNLNQTLAVIKMSIQRSVKAGKQPNFELDNALILLDSVMFEVRNLAKKLVVPSSQLTGLEDNIKNLLNDINHLNPPKFELNMGGVNPDMLDDKLQLTLFRIVQEQVNNILFHSGASSAQIHFGSVEKGIELRISDNGKGSKISGKGKGFGIKNINSRVRLYKGTVNVQSRPGTGYKLKVFIPLNT